MREPIFLCRSRSRQLATALRDFVFFSQVLLFYVLCLALGGSAQLIDRVCGVRLTDRLVRLFELSDEWNHRCSS